MRNFKAIKAVMLGGAAITIGHATPLLAQDGADTENNDVGFGEIVVTAQRRAEKSRDVPLSITAISGESLAKSGVTTTLDLAQVTPGLQMSTVGNFTLPNIRGVTTFVTGPANDTNVAIYLDGVYQPASTSNTFDLPDVDRVEVLKGPQGTLFGRNATGGAIQVFTRTPGFDLTGNATISYANYNDFKAKGFVNVPLVDDKLALSVAGYYNNNDSYYYDVGNGRRAKGAENTLVRAKLLVQPLETVKVLLSFLRSHRTDPSGVYGSSLNKNSLSGLFDPNAIIASQPWETAFDVQPTQVNDGTQFSARVEIELPKGTLTAITGYGKYDNVSNFDVSTANTTDGLGYVQYRANSKDRSFSQEVNYASDNDGPFNFVLGGFYTKGKGAWDRLGVDIPKAATDIDILGVQHYEAAAGFGEVYFDVTDRFTVIGGVRYSWEKRDLSSGLTGPGGDPRNPNDPLLIIPYNRIGQKSWDSITPRVSLRYKLTPVSNVYFTYSQGFKSGVFGTASLGLQADENGNLTQLPLANPEKIKAYEAGFKGRVTDGFNLTAAAFYYDYRDVQVNAYKTVGDPPVALSVLLNAPKARILGLEFEGNMQFSRQFDMQVGVEYLDAKYKKFLVDRTVPYGAGNTTEPNYDAAGQQMLTTPEFSLSAAANFHFDVADGTLDLTGSAYHSSSLNYTFDGRIRQKAYTTFDARVSWTPASDRFTIAAFGRNLSDKAVIGGSFISEISDKLSYAPPRTYGVEATVRF